MLKLADASQMFLLLFLKTSLLEQIDSSVLQVEGCDAHHQCQLASSGSAALRLVYVDLAQLDQPLKAWTQVWVCSQTCRQQNTQLTQQHFGTGALLQPYSNKVRQKGALEATRNLIQITCCLHL